MSRILHLFFLFKGVGSTIQYYLVHLEHGVWKGVEVTSSNYEDFSINYPYLDGLKVVWEVVLSIDLMAEDCLI
eukprot:CAMPEP_0170556268 /NCGR_PEP_ID=MMETSP0211-20121228/16015_1 /TAXON_ID=311385 /ORGANISM="Pseudokeronopsis sp., Strain OXSARD2" /LENGTH=72 /DNA_ID=CAMNT_0010866501 /DNA_START=605 /DNA_END=823 /DNA_ORIENTATION=+